MHLVHDQPTKPAAELEGLAGWLLTILRRQPLFAGPRKRTQRKHMRLLETLPMGPKRHLYLVTCDGERFLVGTGPESVQTITRVRPEGTGLGLVRRGEEL